jgi:hypothetical protein
VIAGLDRAKAQGKKLGRPKIARKVEDAILTGIDLEGPHFAGAT